MWNIKWNDRNQNYDVSLPKIFYSISVSTKYFISRQQNSRFWKFCEGAKRRKRDPRVQGVWGRENCKTVVFGSFRKERSAVSVILECEAREPHTPGEKTTVGFPYDEFVLSWGSYNVTKVTEISWQLHPDLMYIWYFLDAIFSREICCVVIVKFRSLIWKGQALLFFCKM